jgi:hypothetical protein
MYHLNRAVLGQTLALEWRLFFYIIRIGRHCPGSMSEVEGFF